jgi:hypothetical protein
MAFLAAASQRGLQLVVLSPMAYWVLTKRLKSEKPVTDTALTAAEEQARVAYSLSLQVAVRVSMSLPLRSITPSTDSPAKRRSSAAAATTATLSKEGLEHGFALPEDVGRWGFTK